MIIEIIYFFKRLIGRERNEDYEKSPRYSDSSHVQSQKKIINHQVFKPTESPSLPLPKKIIKQHTISHPIVKKTISKSRLMRKIKTNIFFLEELLTMLESDESYASYTKKINEMKIQSEGAFKIVHRMKEDAPYCQNTFKVILNHANTIAQLLEFKIN